MKLTEKIVAILESYVDILDKRSHTEGISCMDFDAIANKVVERIAELEATVTGYENHMDLLEETVRHSFKEREDVHLKRIEELKKEIRMRDMDLFTNEERIAALEAALESKHSRVLDLQAICEKHTERIFELEDENKKLDVWLKAEKAKGAKLSVRCGELKTENEMLANFNGQYKKQQAKLTSALIERISKVESNNPTSGASDEVDGNKETK